MEGIKEKLSLFQELISCNNNLYLWTYSADFELLETNCPKDFVERDNIFLINQSESLLHYAKDGHFPCILDSFLNIMWVAAFERREDKLHHIHIIGPIFFGTNSYQNLKHKLDQRNYSVPARLAVLKQLDSIPIVPSNLLFQYAIMLHYCITGEKITSQKIIHLTSTEEKKNKVHGTSNITKEHPGIWAAEQEFLKMIREGNPDYKRALEKSSFLSSGVKFDTGDPLRKSKNSVLTLLVLCSRAAIEGGLSPSTSYSLCDYYTQKIEEADSISEVTILVNHILEDFVHRVQMTKEQAEISKSVQSCCEYIASNITQSFSIDFLAKRAGYTEYYFSRKFKQEMKTTITEYIKAEKIKYAKLLLSSTTKSIQDISDDLSFSSRSYFSDSFQKLVGISPSEYRKQYLKI